MNHRSHSILLIALLLVPTLAGHSAAQEKTKSQPGAQPAAETDPKAPTRGAPKATAPDSQIPDGAALRILIRRTLLTLNDANWSGNYSVLRDLASPAFQSANNPAKLATVFAKLRSRNLDLAPILLFEPKLVRQPQITETGMLRLSGFFPTRPQQVNFDMLFQQVSGRWRLFGIAVNVAPPKVGAAAVGAKKGNNLQKTGGNAGKKAKAKSK